MHRFILSLFLVVSVVAPLAALATHEGAGVPHPAEKDVFPLVQCGTETATKVCNVGGKDVEIAWVANPCDVCHLFELVKRALDAIWWVLAVPIATIMFIYAGSLMLISSMGGGSGMAERGKRIFWNVLFGILIAFFGWLIVDTVIKFLAGQSIGEPTTARLFENETIGTKSVQGDEGTTDTGVTKSLYLPWNEIQCVRRTAAAAEPACPTVPASSAGGSPGAPTGSVPVAPADVNTFLRNIAPYQTEVSQLAAANGTQSVQSLALIWAESGGVPTVCSSSSCGLMQINVKTAKGWDSSLARLSDAQVADELKNGSTNINLGIPHFSDYLRKYSPSEEDAVAVWNGGDSGNPSLPYDKTTNPHPLAQSKVCPGLKAYQCQWDAPGVQNTGFQQTRDLINRYNSYKAQLQSRGL